MAHLVKMANVPGGGCLKESDAERHEVVGCLHAAENPKTVQQRAELPSFLKVQTWPDGYFQKGRCSALTV
jgi:hypothetical protein